MIAAQARLLWRASSARHAAWAMAAGARRPGARMAHSGPTDSYFGKISQIVDSGAAKYWTIAPERTVFDAVKQMVDHHCGSLVVHNGTSMVGIVTERDYLTKIITRDRASKSTLVDEIMTKDVVSVDIDATIGEAMRVMATHSCRHLPVMQSEELVGVITMRELIRSLADQHERQVNYLHTQIERMASLIDTESHGKPAGAERPRRYWTLSPSS